jgi:hypothetical protein
MVHMSDFLREMQHIKQHLQELLRRSVLPVSLPLRSMIYPAYDGVGTGVSVVGIFSWNVLGSFTVNYTLDGVSSSQTYTVTPTTPQYKATGELQPIRKPMAPKWESHSRASDSGHELRKSSIRTGLHVIQSFIQHVGHKIVPTGIWSNAGL